jgi:nicotinamide-nucleotide amidase
VNNYCEIITIGDELLIGQVVDTNSAWIGRELNKTGIEVVQKTAISDNVEHIVSALNSAKTRARIILITGGLGPTKDDLTKQTLATYFNSGWRTDAAVEEHIRKIFEARNLPILDVNLEQAVVPDNCETIFNHQGTAPGMWFEEDGHIFVSMPGVPYEMVSMMENFVLPRLEQLDNSQNIIHKTIVTAGIGESFLAKKIDSVEDNLPKHIKLAYLPHFTSVRLRFTARGEDETGMLAELEDITTRIKELVGEYVIADEDIKLEQLIGRLLKERGQMLATAESCTGGYIAHLITSIPGSSAYFMGSVVSYDNKVKMGQLGVKAETLAGAGAVSSETVEQMARGVIELLCTDYAIATSGIAGPDGGTPEKPVGTVWIAVANKQKVLPLKFNFHGTRQAVIERTAITALNMLRKLILEH